MSDVMDSIAKYAAVFGRPPAVVRKPTGKWAVSVCMFPPLKRSFWKGLISEAHDETVYVTSGMSLYSMPTDALQPAYETNVELMAFSELPIGGGLDGKEDIPTAILQLIANYVLDAKILIGVGHTLDFQEKLSTNTQMSGALFAFPDGVDVKRIRRCTNAQELLNVVPITGPELELARSQGVGALLEEFEKAQVRPIFDYLRDSAV